MKRAAWLGCVVVLAGCQGGEANPAESTSAPTPKPVAIERPATTTPSQIALVIKKQPITVGFSPGAAFDMFRRDPKAGFEYNDLPPKFQFPYRARTWEEATTGFGEIIYDGDLVAAVYTEEKGDQARVDELVKAHQAQLGGMEYTPVSGKHVTYYFWEKDRQRLMICAYPTSRDVVKITVAMGDDVVMDGLGMSVEQAQKDQVVVDAAISRSNAASATAIRAPG